MNKWAVRLAAAASVASAISGCSSPVDSSHNNKVTATFNDTSWTAAQVLYLKTAYSATDAVFVNFAAVGGSDTIEVNALALEGATYSLAQPTDCLRLRRARGVFQDTASAHMSLDSIQCTRLSNGLIQGTIWTVTPITRTNDKTDSLRLMCQFSLSY